MSDYDAPAYYEETTRKAAKGHTCCECRNPIAIGDRHHVMKGVWDGEWRTYRMCIPCHDLLGRLLDVMPHSEYPPFGELHEWAKEMDVE